MKMYRIDAINALGVLKVARLTNEMREGTLADAIAEFGIEEDESFDEDQLLQDLYKIYIADYTNKYLAEYLSEQLAATIDVEGDEPDFFQCPCCGYKTLSRLHEYDICKVCYWEDDGTVDERNGSIVNQMTLGDAIKTFKEIGAISRRMLQYVDPDRMKQFAKS